MTKSELIELIARKQTQFSQKDVELAINQILDSMIDTLSEGDRIEIRGFGSFSLHHRKARMGRNPKTGEKVQLNCKSVCRTSSQVNPCGIVWMSQRILPTSLVKFVRTR